MVGKIQEYWKKFTGQNGSSQSDHEDENPPFSIDGENEAINSEKNPEIEHFKKLWGQMYAYCSTLPVLGFNSGKYDLNLMKSTLLPGLGFGGKLQDEKWAMSYDRFAFIIRKNNSYSAICANGIKFIDAIQYLSAGVSYSNFLQAYSVTESKSYLPYEWIDSVEKLDHPEMPPYEAFYSELKQMNVLEEGGDENLGRQRYSELVDLWKANGWTKFSDLLSYYNNLDVGPFVKAAERMQDFYFQKGIDVFKCAISLPGVSRRMLFETAEKEGVSFASINVDDEDLYYIFRRNLVGGPSIIYHREHCVDKTCLFNLPDHVCRAIKGYDANALYLFSIDQKMPCGGYVRRIGPDFKPVCRLYRQSMYDWLDYIALTENKKIQHGRNGGEVRVGKYLVDGFCFETNEVFEFNGCYYHGCNECGKNNTDELKRKILSTENRRKEIEELLKTTIRSIQECQFKAWVKEEKGKTRNESPNLFDFTESRLPPFYKKYRFNSSSTDKILSNVRSGVFFGMLEVDVEVPDHLHQKFSEMSPFFGTADIPVDDIGKPMKDHLAENNINFKSRKLLIGAMKAEKILLHSELLQWYLSHGIVVTKLYQVIEFTPNRCFRPFVNLVTNARRNGDNDPSMKPVADGCKLLGNAAYGSIIMDKEKHSNVTYVNNVGQAQQYINSPNFKSINKIRECLYEVVSSKQNVKVDLPIQLGFTILQFAKLKMLQFYYDFLQPNCKENSFQLCEMDTDSLYMAMTGENIEAILRSDCMRTEFSRNLRVSNCNDLPYGPDQGHFLPRECCSEHSKYDNRTPGLFKLEASGTEMVSLCSKTYSLEQNDGTCKFSSKGLNKRALTNPHSVFKNVLETGNSASGVNRGILAVKNKMVNYEQTRNAISYFYCKREVLADGRSTKPLKTVLRLWPDRNVEVVDENHVLWPDRTINVHLRGKHYKSLFDVCLVAVKLDDPVSLLIDAFRAIEPYQSEKELIFTADGSFTRRKYSENSCMYWTTGMNLRSSQILPESEWPGINKLGEAWTLSRE